MTHVNISTDNLEQLPRLDARVPQWSLDLVNERPCPMCGARNMPQLRRPDGLPLASCGLCGLWYVCSLPPVGEIQSLYQGYWYSFHPRKLDQSYADYLASAHELLADDIRLIRLEAIAGGLNGKRMLDIGCGCGEFLVAAKRRGALVYGNDISPESCSFIGQFLNFPIVEGPLNDQVFLAEHGFMDIVAMNDLIEHAIEPSKLLASALAILRPGGLLLVLTPNGGMADRTWVGFRVDLEHLQYFSPQTITKFASAASCTIEHLESFGYPYLTDIDKPPRPSEAPHPPMSRWKNRVKQLRWLRHAVHALRAARHAYDKPEPNVRQGTYHLLAIVKKESINESTVG